MWSEGDRVWHRFNADLGAGEVMAADPRRVVVFFPEGGEQLEFAASTDALEPVTLTAGMDALLIPEEERVTVGAVLDNGDVQLADGRQVEEDRVWPFAAPASPIVRLANGSVDTVGDFVNRLDGLRLERLREADGLGSFLGGRIRIFPHQLYAAEAACSLQPVRWLLADGVGLGKTVEACLIMNRLIHTGRAERVLVVAPDALTVQWLGELWRKHHQVFVLLDEARIAQVENDQGADFNPFEVHRRAIISLELMTSDPRLADMAVATGVDLLVVDEAHHLQRPEGHPGNPAYRAIAPMAALGRNMLLLTATPLEDDALGFLRLVQLLRPEEFADVQALLTRLQRRQSLPACTTSTRAVDVGGWPARQPDPVEFDEEQWAPMLALEHEIRKLPAANAAQRDRKAELMFRALASPASLKAVKSGLVGKALKVLQVAERDDPRIDWLVDQLPRWRRQGDKTLIFVAHRESLESLKVAIERRCHLRAGLFHEELSVKRRDVEAARFRLPDGPSVLISTECGGEGRNFEFCRRLVLFDLPWHPGVVEQRIGRLDRIGRTAPTEIVYFRPPQGLGAAVVQLFEAMELFNQSQGGIDRELRHVAREVERVAGSEATEVGEGAFDQVLASAVEARTRVQEAAYHELHRQPYREAMADEILARVPGYLEKATADLVLRAAAAFGFDVEQQSGSDTWFIEIGVEALIDRLPGVGSGARFLGTFDREEAVRNEGLDFFSSGHPLVEGVLAELSYGRRGRSACLEIFGDEECMGLFVLYRRDAELVPWAVDAQGNRREDVEVKLMNPSQAIGGVDSRRWTALPGWAEAVQRMADALPNSEVPEAAAAFRVRVR